MANRFLAKGDVHFGDRWFRRGLSLIAIGVILVLLAIGYRLGILAWPVVEKFGLSFFTGTVWNPAADEFGAAAFIYGTLVSSLIALLLATPLSIGVAVFLSEMASDRVGKFVAFVVEMLAAVPSVVFGLWGIFALAPIMRIHVQPFLQKSFGFLPLFQGTPYGVGMLTAGLILALTITPTISSICREVFQAVPRTQREAALALGATPWETIRLAVLASSSSGILGAVILGLGRALGETMAVTMVIGNRSAISTSLFAPGQTMASIIANEYAEAGGGLHIAALASVGLALFCVSFVVNFLARMLVRRIQGSKGQAVA